MPFDGSWLSLPRIDESREAQLREQIERLDKYSRGLKTNIIAIIEQEAKRLVCTAEDQIAALKATGISEDTLIAEQKYQDLVQECRGDMMKNVKAKRKADSKIEEYRIPTDTSTYFQSKALLSRIKDIDDHEDFKRLCTHPSESQIRRTLVQNTCELVAYGQTQLRLYEGHIQPVKFNQLKELAKVLPRPGNSHIDSPARLRIDTDLARETVSRAISGKSSGNTKATEESRHGFPAWPDDPKTHSRQMEVLRGSPVGQPGSDILRVAAPNVSTPSSASAPKNRDIGAEYSPLAINNRTVRFQEKDKGISSAGAAQRTSSSFTDMRWPTPDNINNAKADLITSHNFGSRAPHPETQSRYSQQIRTPTLTQPYDKHFHDSAFYRYRQAHRRPKR